MSQPFSGIPDPGARPPIRRRTQPGTLHLESLRQAISNGFRKTRSYSRELWYQAQRQGQPWYFRGKRYSRDLWLQGKRHPRALGLVATALVLTLVGAYTLSASGAGRSLCPPPAKGKTIQFSVLVDRVPHATSGSELEIHYDVCGLPAGTPYHGRAKLSQQRAVAKKASQPKPLVVAFRDKVDGLATRRNQDIDLTYTKPGTYSLELLVVDNKGRERKKTQRVVIQAR